MGLSHLAHLLCLGLALAASGLAGAQTTTAGDAARGRALYHTVIVPGQPSCANGACHGPSPALRQNRIHLGSTADDVDYAIRRVYSMGFLIGTLGRRALADLATYIADAEREDERRDADIRPAALDHGAVALGDAVGGSAAFAVRNTGAQRVTVRALAIEGEGFSVAGTTCTSGLQLTPGAACKITLRFLPARVGASSGSLRVAFDAPVGERRATITAQGVARGTTVGARMVEFMHAGLAYYFQTARPDEQAALDALADFERTGASYPVAEDSRADTVPLSRFYFDRIARFGQRGSHFYTASDDEKSLLRALNPGNAATPRLPVDEGPAARVRLPLVADDGGRSCPTGWTPVLRLFRGAAYPDDANHRFTTDPVLYAQAVAEDWAPEGIAYCVPTP
jgi:hypothetical protein